MSNGLLHIVARQEAYNGSAYTSAKLKSFGLFTKKYGRVEFRAQLPQGQGYWPALWLMPEDSVYGRCAASGAIALMENTGNAPTHVLVPVHFRGLSPHQAQAFGPSYA